MLCDNNSKVIVIGQVGILNVSNDYDNTTSNDDNDDVNIKARTICDTSPDNIISITSSFYELGILLKKE